MQKKISLNGLWKFTHEPEQRPTNNHHAAPGETCIYASPDLNRRQWEEYPVPGVWQRYAEKYSIYEGVCWFCKSFTLSEITDGTRARLRFGAVANNAEVYINGEYAGCHDSGYTEFTVDVTGYLKNGENLIAVKADNRALTTKWPNDRGYMAYGGIHRSVTLELFDDVYLENFVLTPDYDAEKGQGILCFRGNVCGLMGPVTVYLRGDQYMMYPDENGNIAGEWRICGLTPWTPEKPKLYDLTVRYGEELCIGYTVGFKSLTRKDGKLYLNGEQYRIKGAAYVYDSPRYGIVFDREQIEHDLCEMKEAGVNTVRLHFAMDESFYALCDRMGFLVWTETNVYCSRPDADAVGTVFSKPEYIRTAEVMMREIIATARGHVSVAFYSVGNECTVTNHEADAFFRRLSGIAREEDPTRLVGYAAMGDIIGNMGEIVDVLGINSYVGWYDRISRIPTSRIPEPVNGMIPMETLDLRDFHSMMRDLTDRIPGDVPILLTEFGADALEDFRSPTHEIWSEEYQADIIREAIRASYVYPRVQGTCVFCFTDYHDPAKLQNGYWNGYNLKGMLTFSRIRRQAFYALKKEYTE